MTALTGDRFIRLEIGGGTMRVLGVVILSVTGAMLLVFSLVGFFAHSMVDSFWMHIASTAGQIGGSEVGSAMQAGSVNTPIWPSVVLALLAATSFAGALLLAMTGSRPRRPSIVSGRTAYLSTSYSRSRPPSRRRREK